MQAHTIGRGLAVLVVAVAGALVGVAPSQAAPSTVVSLTFDDGQASQVSAVPILQSHGMKGTFYIESGDVGAGSYYMSWAQVAEVAGAGNEIGGHTLHHTNLTTVSQAEATAAVCDDRANLRSHGYDPTSFAYPYGAVDATAESVVRSCGYRSGRGVGGGKESIPPPDPYRLRTAAVAGAGTGLAGLQSSVTSAESSGGWVIILFHGICDNACTGSSSTDLSTFRSFLDWLQARSGSGTVVRTVGDVMSGGTPPPSPPSPPPPPPPPPPPVNAAPTTTIACNGAACRTTAYSAAVSVTLTATDPEGSATTTYYTTDGTDPRTSTSRHTYGGAFSVSRTSTVRYSSTDTAGATEAPKSQQIQIAGSPPPVTNRPPTTSVTCNGGACSTGWYRRSPVRVTLTARDPEGAPTTTYYTTDGSDPVTSRSRRTYGGPFAVAETGTVKFYSVDASGLREATKSQELRIDTLAPRVAITAPRTGRTYVGTAKASITISARALDRATGTKSASGIARVVFYDGRKRIGVARTAVPGASTYRVSWHPLRVGKHVLTARAADVAGNTARSRPVTVYVRRH